VGCPEGRHLAVCNPNGTVYVLRLAQPAVHQDRARSESSRAAPPLASRAAPTSPLHLAGRHISFSAGEATSGSRGQRVFEPRMRPPVPPPPAPRRAPEGSRKAPAQRVRDSSAIPWRGLRAVYALVGGPSPHARRAFEARKRLTERRGR
jgi:hypothetical protein